MANLEGATMSKSIRFIAEYYDSNTGKVIQSKILRDTMLKRPATLKELGYMHSEQIELLQSIQDFKIKHESVLINQITHCPKCKDKLASTGVHQSNFHAALTDHKVNIQRKSCRCGWSSPRTVSGIYGCSSHPDLIEKQVIQGAENSYRQASRQLNAESKKERSINNDDRIRRNVELVSELIENHKLKRTRPLDQELAAEELTVVVDGGHLKSNKKGSRSFEAMIATVYRPENIRYVDKHHNEITQKTSVASAKSDNQKTIKKLLLNACRKEGVNARVTQLTCLTDGANNCWSITKSLKRCCKKLVNVLDWFHITKRFTVINNRVDDDFKVKLEKVKWFLWHGKAEEALQRLGEIKNDIDDRKVLLDLQDLYEYIFKNQTYLVNYQERQAEGLAFTSTLAESSVNSLINMRQKDNKKMQWSREGAHSILQIRTSRFSKAWTGDWEAVEKEMYKNAA